MDLTRLELKLELCSTCLVFKSPLTQRIDHHHLPLPSGPVISFHMKIICADNMRTLSWSTSSRLSFSLFQGEGLQMQSLILSGFVPLRTNLVLASHRLS